VLEENISSEPYYMKILRKLTMKVIEQQMFRKYIPITYRGNNLQQVTPKRYLNNRGFQIPEMDSGHQLNNTFVLGILCTEVNSTKLD
ncbi:hypothetical protein CEXT_756461, partial [Caerostris extrusa]